jgi:hypothetical protein
MNSLSSLSIRSFFKIINDAEAEAKNITLKKERIESELKEFIQAEKELIKKYEDAGK